MPRGRRPLTDKQERLLVQCQLMSMNTADLVTVSNRLKALDRENQFRARVAEASHGFTWTVKNKREFTLTDQAGHVYEVKCYSDYSNHNWNYRGSDYAKITVSRPGTRFKPRTVADHKLANPWNDIEIASACPEGSKYLYHVMRDIKTGRFK